MNADIRFLIRQLCTPAGMIMEDASVSALQAPQEEQLDDLAPAADAIAVLVLAAQALRARR